MAEAQLRQLFEPPKRKINLFLDEGQQHAALLVASGELDSFTDRITDTLKTIGELRARYLAAIAEKDRDVARECLMELAGCIGRIGDYADAVR